jgi:hypothetical protein
VTLCAQAARVFIIKQRATVSNLNNVIDHCDRLDRSTLKAILAQWIPCSVGSPEFFPGCRAIEPVCFFIALDITMARRTAGGTVSTRNRSTTAATAKSLWHIRHQ